MSFDFRNINLDIELIVYDYMRLELVLTRNTVGEEIKLYSSEKASLSECANELLYNLQDMKKKGKTKKIERMIEELQNILKATK
ncbi:MAG: hypothetical protein ACFFDS_05300 [Candidatus Thorarchaeota archaeon]